MKITKRQLRKIIREAADEPRFQNAGEQYLDDMAMQGGEFQGAMLDLDDYDDLRESVIEFAKEYAANTGYETNDILMALKSIIEEI